MEVVQLLNQGASIDTHYVDVGGWMVLIAAAARGHASTVLLLLKHGADASITAKNEKIPLDFEHTNGNPEVVQALKAGGREKQSTLTRFKRWRSDTATAPGN